MKWNKWILKAEDLQDASAPGMEEINIFLQL